MKYPLSLAELNYSGDVRITGEDISNYAYPPGERLRYTFTGWGKALDLGIAVLRLDARPKVKDPSWPGPFELIRDADKERTPDGLRALLIQNAWHSPVLRHVFVHADFEGMSGEDRYTTVAWHLLLEAEKLRDIALRQASRALDAPLVIRMDECPHCHKKLL